MRAKAAVKLQAPVINEAIHFLLSLEDKVKIMLPVSPPHPPSTTLIM